MTLEKREYDLNALNEQMIGLTNSADGAFAMSMVTQMNGDPRRFRDFLKMLYRLVSLNQVPADEAIAIRVTPDSIRAMLTAEEAKEVEDAFRGQT